MSWIKNQYVIIDYGSSSVRGILCESSFAGDRILRMEKMFTSPFAPSLPLPNTKEEDEKRQESVQEEYENNIIRFVESFFPGQNHFILSLPLHKLYVRDLSLPPIKPNQLAQAIEFEAEESLPYSLENLDVVGHTWLSHPEQIQFLCFAAPKKFIERRIRPFSKDQTVLLGLSVDSVMLSCFLRALGQDFCERRIIGQLDIGSSHTLLNVVKNGKLAFTRSLPYGGDQLTEIVSSVLSLKDMQAAEERKIELGVPQLEFTAKEFCQEHSLRHLEYHKLTQKAEAWVKELCQEIERSLLGLRCLPPDSFYISGGVSLTKDLDTLIENNLKINVKRYPLSLDTSDSPELWALALGAMEQRKVPTRDRNNFLSTSFGASLVGKKFNFAVLKIPATLLSAASVIFLFSLGIGVVQSKAKIAEYQENIQKVASGIPGILAEATSQEILTQAQVICLKRLRSLNRSTKKILGILRELSDKSPSVEEMDLIFRELKFDGKGIILQIEHANVGDSTVFQEKLNTSSLFRGVEVKHRNILPNQRVKVRYKMEVVESGAGGFHCL